jgi:hypothetical protein
MSPNPILGRLRRRAVAEAVDAAVDALDGADQRTAFRMHYSLGQIEGALDAVDYTSDRRWARVLARIRARVDAYYQAQEGGGYR